jgi:hypothetical protein
VAASSPSRDRHPGQPDRARLLTRPRAWRCPHVPFVAEASRCALGAAVRRAPGPRW